MKKKEVIDKLYTKVPAFGKLFNWCCNAALGNRLIILNYHSVVEDSPIIPDWCTILKSQFEEQLHAIKENFIVLPLIEGIERCKENRLEGPSIAITFDDGYQNNFDFAFPLLQKMQVPSTIFLTTDFVDSSNILWFNRLRNALEQTDRRAVQWRGHEYSLQTIQEKSVVLSIVESGLKIIPHPMLLQEVERLIEYLVEPNSLQDGLDSPYSMLNAEQISIMQDSGLVSFGAHTAQHAILSRISPEEQLDQINLSVKRVAELTGCKCQVFAYPNGGKNDFDAGVYDLLLSQGVKYAVTMVSGFNTHTTPELELKRIGIGNDWSLGVFQVGLHTGISDIQLPKIFNR